MITIREMRSDSEIMDVRDLAIAHHEEYGGSREFDSAAVCHSGMDMCKDTTREHSNCWIAYDEKVPVGYIAVTRMRNFYNWRFIAVQQMWYVSPGWRGTRAGIKLVKEFEAWALKHKCEASYMSVEHNAFTDETERTARLLDRLGYKRRGIYAIKHMG
jgi:GNAT superfamily N-acetyltransferase